MTTRMMKLGRIRSTPIAKALQKSWALQDRAAQVPTHLSVFEVCEELAAL
eukprot:CAMPEP_0117559416 /NCGR_PEP_ID=MMETSP0784-20121206/53353_1 /TAXON_ID=39447 /ORGANISM="" /LENGTH=49 /DNA_ID=CAMNT_0005356801 /DNA_START=370 /DNA_END=519 /DNA_ORIENTATION=+